MADKLSPADQAKADADAKQAELDKQVEEAKQAAITGPADDDGDGDDDTHEVAEPTDARSKAEAASKRLRLIGMAYPNTTPNEHVIFGFGGQLFTLGELRALFNLQGA